MNKQIDLAMATYIASFTSLLDGSEQLPTKRGHRYAARDVEDGRQYKAIQQAYKAAVAYGDSDAETIIKDYGNDPRIIKLLNGSAPS